MFPYSESPTLLREYLSSLLVQQEGKPVFSKLNILSDPKTLFTVGESTGRTIPESSDAVCILASSGIPIGIVAALSKGKSVYFYHRMGWQRKGIPVFIVPSPPPNLEIAIVDSHVRSGFSSRTAYLELTDSYRSQVLAICAPILFDPLLKYRCPVIYTSLSNYENVRKILSELIQEPEPVTEARIQDLHGAFWSYPPTSQIPLDEFKAQAPIRKWKWYIPTRSPCPSSELLSTETRDLINQHIGLSDQGVWDFFQFPHMVKRICEITGSAISISQYDYLVGIQPLGTALAVALAYYNQDVFKGQIVSWLGQAGFLPRITHWEKKKILPVTVRVQFGTYLADVVSEILRQNGQIEQVLVAISDFRASTLFNRYRQNAMASLSKSGIKFLMLS